MSKKLLFLFFAFFPLVSYGMDYTPQENSQIGRYQLVAHESACLYLLDTTTGQVWRSDGSTFSWYHDTWKLQIPGFENKNDSCDSSCK